MEKIEKEIKEKARSRSGGFVRVTISMPADLEKDVKRYARKNGVTFSGMIQILLDNFLKSRDARTQ